MEAVNQLAISIIRTVVPIVAGQFISWFALMGIMDATGELTAALISAMTVLFTSGYYILARYLEVKVNAKFGWLLGYAKKPTYKMPK